jgi:ABC-type Fe3+/spermidine/putrescine transport system ATPase subunit
MVAIAVEGLSKRFGTQVALDGIDLRIEHGELFFLLGPSGCGKTTLLRHIAGFYQPDGGVIRFDGEDVSRVPAHRRGTGMMFQSYALWPHLTVAQNVAFGLEERRRPAAEIRVRVDEVLAAVQLPGLGGRRIQQLSGGQQQRVALARALVIRPNCLLLDEPLSNLDAKLRLEMRLEIRRICKEFGLTGIYVTHDQEEALSMADRLAIMDRGRLAQVGAPLEVYRNPVNRMAAEFIGETNFIAGVVAETDGSLLVVDTALGWLRSEAPSAGSLVRASQRIVLSVRPEAIRFADESSAGNRWLGRIVDTMYLGAAVQYHVETDAGTVLKLARMNPSEILEPSDHPVMLTADPCDIVPLPE